jgi:hypothetical protein
MKDAIYRIGLIRYKYLDLSNMSFAQGDFVGCMGYINAFLETIKEGTPIAETIRKEFAKIEEERKERVKKLGELTENLGYLEQKDAKERGRQELEIDAVHNRKNICWTISLMENLFND